MKKMQSIVLALSLVLRDHGWWKQHYEWRGNRWHPHGPPPPPRHHKKAPHDHHGGHGPGKHHR
ncbi:MAG: hypothetical protein E7B35_22110 [Escherichia coli]|nr:hypothetical protein [Escherichia coli]